jgi:hypothetical protein
MRGTQSADCQKRARSPANLVLKTLSETQGKVLTRRASSIPSLTPGRVARHVFRYEEGPASKARNMFGFLMT